mmetsp:Transcript_14636/g.52693  ORF Transcript_14636/g.52693 Transcript_14636/m.52693 type:complete len:249 (+) Transcript_14636:287-1033(+)
MLEPLHRRPRRPGGKLEERAPLRRVHRSHRGPKHRDALARLVVPAAVPRVRPQVLHVPVVAAAAQEERELVGLEEAQPPRVRATREPAREGVVGARPPRVQVKVRHRVDVRHAVVARDGHVRAVRPEFERGDGAELRFFHGPIQREVSLDVAVVSKHLYERSVKLRVQGREVVDRPRRAEQRLAEKMREVRLGEDSLVQRLPGHRPHELDDLQTLARVPRVRARVQRAVARRAREHPAARVEPRGEHV